jgi:hypothetical protein
VTRPRCLWCHGADGTLVPLREAGLPTARPLHVHPAHEAELRAYLLAATAAGPRLVRGLLLILVLAIPGMLIAYAVGDPAPAATIGAAITLIGALVIARPVALPQSVGVLGVRRSVLLTRTLGIATAAIGALLMIAALTAPPRPQPPDDPIPPPAREIGVYFTRAEAPIRVPRSIPADSPALRAALLELLRGPTPDERAAGIASWFSDDTAGMLADVTVDEAGHATIDFRDFRHIIPGASSAAGSAMLLGELHGTIFQFPEIAAASYRFDGDCDAFWNWLQRGCTLATRSGTGE